MNLERDYEDFAAHHRNPWNLAFHVFCGLIYMSLLFTITGLVWVILYGAVTLCLMRRRVLAVLITVTVLAVSTWAISLVEIDLIYRVIGVVVFYLMPELSHLLTGEKAVLSKDKLTVVNIVLNFFLLLPYCVAAGLRR